jgi:uncharacterized membrane protein YidH (DUF202 family)
MNANERKFVKIGLVTYVRRVLFGMAASTVAVTIIYLSGILISVGLTRRYAMSSGSDTIFVERHWHLWPIIGIALVAFVVGFARPPRTR